MEVTILSREIIKPSLSPSHLQNLKPQNLCVFDQLTPNTYPGVVLFYDSITNPNLSETLTKLKTSLSQTLSIFYTFSGTTKTNLYTDDFNAGVPFLEAKINQRLSEYFTDLSQNLEPLNNLVPYKPFRRETNPWGPQIAFQVTLFSCGSISIGSSVCHKKSDGATLSHFIQTWSHIFTNSQHKITPPNLTEPATSFPPLPRVPPRALSLMDHLWFKESSYVTRRFFFDAKSIQTLKTLATSSSVQSPTRNEAVSCFIWKHAAAASWAVSGKPRATIAAHAVNIRGRVSPTRADLLARGTGNLFWWAAVAANPASEAEMGLAELVALTREMMSEFGEEYLESMAGEKGFEPISEFLTQLEAMLELEDEKPDIFGFTNWKGYFNGIDFGWGKPVWVGAHGKVGSEFRNLIVLIDKQGNGKEIEAFVTLEEKMMSLLVSDSEFLAFASTKVPLPVNIVSSHDVLINSSKL